MLYSYIRNYIRRILFGSTQRYWENRYAKGGNSGHGSYGKLANYKAKEINLFVKQHKIASVVEFGCGDGNQLSMAKYPKYIGLDVSITAIQQCIKKFSNDRSKSFFLYRGNGFADSTNVFKSDLSLSLDVIFHLIEDKIFEKYMRDLFSSSGRFVIIYSSNTDENSFSQGVHVRHRMFTKWIKKNITGWRLERIINNKYPLIDDDHKGSFSNYYIYKKLS